MATTRGIPVLLLWVPAWASAVPVFGDGFEPLSPPPPGSIVFTEIMANPDAVADDAGEWFEIANVGSRGVDLVDCTLQRTSGSSTVDASLPLAAGGLAVFARSLDTFSNGNVPADATFGFSLTTADLLSLDCDGLLVDATEWSTTTAGRSRSLDRAAWDAAANDGDANWCLSVMPYNGTDTGTPGSDQHDCDTGDPVFPAPLAGELRITELMSDPAGTLSDMSAEWVELLSLAPATVGLDSCTLGNAGSGSMALTGLTVAPGERRLLVRSSDTGTNGGLTADAVLPFSLTNAGGTLLVNCEGNVIDQATYGAGQPGRSIVRAADTSFCVAPAGTAEYFPGNFGTPRQADTPACSP